MSTKMRVFYGDGDSAITDADTDTSVLVFKVFDNDKEVGRLEIDGNDLPADNQQRTYLYGINKLLTDRTSSEKDKLIKLVQMEDVFDLLVSGEWAKERAVGAIEVSVYVEALAEMTKQSIPDTQAGLGQYDKEVRAAILAREDVQKLGKEIAAKRSARTLSSLDEFVPA